MERGGRKGRELKLCFTILKISCPSLLSPPPLVLAQPVSLTDMTLRVADRMEPLKIEVFDEDVHDDDDSMVLLRTHTHMNRDVIETTLTQTLHVCTYTDTRIHVYAHTCIHEVPLRVYIRRDP